MSPLTKDAAYSGFRRGLAGLWKAERTILLGDIGGTNARFALSSNGRMGPIETYHTADFPGIVEAIRSFLGHVPEGSTIKRALLGVAGPVKDGHCTLTNIGWTIDADELREIFDLEHVDLLNDFAAVAWSLPHLDRGDLLQIGGGSTSHYEPAAVLGAGTGLGLACFVPNGDASFVLQTEGGHATLPGANKREDAVIDYLRGRFGHVSAERALSGGGIVNLYQALAAIDGVNAPEREASEITAAATSGTCLLSQEALNMFCAMLGTFAGNAALTLRAQGGVFLSGGIAPRIHGFLEQSQFRSRFEAKGRFSKHLARIGTYVITHDDPAFIGLQVLAEKNVEHGQLFRPA
jgi:glucokinase